VVNLKHPPARPLKRGIPGTSYYFEITPVMFTVKMRGSRRPGVSLALMELLGCLSVPDNAPAKFHGDPIAYLHWIASKVRIKRK